MNNKIIFIIITIFSFLIIDNVNLISQDNKNSQSEIDSIWEYEAAAVNTMTFLLFKNGKFIYKDSNIKMESEGKWKYNLFKTQILITFTDNKEYWDKMIFSDKQFLKFSKRWVGYYNKSERTVGFYIYESDVSGGKYFNFFGFYYYKK